MLFKTLLTIAATASAAPFTNPAGLQPWQLLALETFSPSGRPGNDPYSMLNVTIKDPNIIAAQAPTGQAIIPPSSASCSAQWLDNNPPWGQSIACNSDSGISNWSFTINQGTSGTTNFTLDFNLVEIVTISGMQYEKTWIGGDHFEVGTNLGGSCGGSGVCSWGLASAPYDINQE